MNETYHYWHFSRLSRKWNVIIIIIKNILNKKLSKIIFYTLCECRLKTLIIFYVSDKKESLRQKLSAIFLVIPINIFENFFKLYGAVKLITVALKFIFFNFFCLKLSRLAAILETKNFSINSFWSIISYLHNLAIQYTEFLFKRP